MKKRMYQLCHKHLFHHKLSIPRAIFFFAIVCWMGALLQSPAIYQKILQREAIPAFQDNVSTTLSKEEAVTTAFCTKQTMKLTPSSVSSLSKDTATSYCNTLCSLIDSDASIISSHTEKNYTDFYCYSPLLKEYFNIDPYSESNLQIAFTWDQEGNCTNIYLGFPCIDYDF